MSKHVFGKTSHVGEDCISCLTTLAWIVVGRSYRAMKLWGRDSCDNRRPATRFSFIPAWASGAKSVLMKCHLHWEAESPCRTWFARVSMQGILADHPPRFQKFEVLAIDLCCTSNAIPLCWRI